MKFTQKESYLIQGTMIALIIITILILKPILFTPEEVKQEAMQRCSELGKINYELINRDLPNKEGDIKYRVFCATREWSNSFFGGKSTIPDFVITKKFGEEEA